MIAFAETLPMVRFADGEITGFRASWLAKELRDAAARAGHQGWWLAEHVSESVTRWLRDSCDEPVIGVDRLEAAVREVLQVIGFGEVAPMFRAGRPPVEISLPELARAAGTGYELAFFDLLNQRIRQCLATPVRELRLHGLERCVKQLCTKKVWCRECDRLRSEIVSFVREQFDAAAPQHAVSVSLV